MEVLLRICGVALVCGIAGLILSRIQGEYAALVRIGGLILLGAFLFSGVSRGLDSLLSMLGGETAVPYARVMIRALGIGMLTRLCGSICGECGAGGLCAAVELAGKLLIVVLCLPLIQDILTLADRILQMGA